jgi:hypothetical protein
MKQNNRQRSSKQPGFVFADPHNDLVLNMYQRSYQRGEMQLVILVHRNNVAAEVIQVSAQNTGRAGLANKGGIVAELLINGTTRISFLTAHLEAHEGNYKVRDAGVKRKK